MKKKSKPYKYYYLHRHSKNLIYKTAYSHDELLMPDYFTEHTWIIDESSRANAWQIILESLALGASIDRVRDLSTKWGCTEDDFNLLLVNAPLTDLMKKGIPLFFKAILNKEYQQVWVQ